MVAAALEIVTSYAPVPEQIDRVAHILFIIAAALQVAIWARELILGAVAQPGRRGAGRIRRSAMRCAIIRVLVSVALFALALDRHPRQSRGQRHHPGRRARHRRHRHRPRRAGHFLRPVRGACDRVRPPVPARRHDPLRRPPPARSSASASRRPGSAPQAGEHGDHGQHQVARPGDPQHRRAPASAASWLPFGVIYQTAPELLERMADTRRARRSSRSRAAGWCAARSPRFGDELDRLRAGLRRPLERFRHASPSTIGDLPRHLAHRSPSTGSNSPIRPRPPSPRRPTGRMVMPYAAGPAGGPGRSKRAKRKAKLMPRRQPRRHPRAHRRGGRRLVAG